MRIVPLLFVSFAIVIGVALAEHLRVNCGGGSFTDSNGLAWTSDHALVSGSKTLYSPRPVFANTSDAQLYLSERWCDNCVNTPLMYTFNLQNGSYLVRLHFVKHVNTNQAGNFYFKINEEENTMVDISTEVGISKALVKTVYAFAMDGKLVVSFSSGTEKARISGIEIVESAIPVESSSAPVEPVESSPTPDPCAQCVASCCSQQCYNAQTHQCVNGVVQEIQQDIQPGVVGYYYDYRELGDNMVEFPKNLKKPVLAFVEQGIFNKPQDYSLFRNSPWENYFAVRYYFNLNIEQAGTYTFWSRSNDGTILYIDGNRVLNNDYNKDIESDAFASGTVTLTAGTHKVQYDFYQSMHRSGLTFKWIRPGQTTEEFVPGELFTYTRSEMRPVITSLSAPNGPAGSTITINGFGFVFSGSQTTVQFGNVPATSVTVVSDSELQVVVPNGVSGAVSVMVQTPNDSSNSQPFTIN